LPLTIRNARRDELSGLSDLCFRSKAVWGYDAAFMEACRDELSFDRQELQSTSIAVAELGGNPVGVAQVTVVGSEAELLKLFVEPAALRKGIGRTLLNWAIDISRAKGAVRLTIDADPDAVPFYRRIGACDAGEAPSGSIPGRMLPRLTIEL
jgi:GNAT superfamily N-acetyltransferase